MSKTPPLADILKAVQTRLDQADRDDAIKTLQDQLGQTPEHFSGWLMLSRLLFEAERYGDAVQASQKTEQLDPHGAQFQAIQRAMQSRDLAAASQTAQAMLKDIPGHPRAIFTLAHIHQARGDFEAAAIQLDEGLKTSPANLTLHAMKVGALEQAGRYRDAVHAAELIACLDDGFQSLFALGTLLLRYGQNERALAICDRLVPLAGYDRGKASAVALVRAQLLRVLGHHEEAVASFRRSLNSNPANASAWWGLADLKTHSFTNADRTALTALMTRRGLNPRDQSLAAFALAKAEEAADGAKAAFARYHDANQKHPTGSFNADAFDAAVERLIREVGAAALDRQAKVRARAARPLFILGLPRSGSTLVEQILASHSQIEGTMEQPTLPAIKRRAHLLCRETLGGDYLSKLGEISVDALGQLGESYLEESRLFRQDAAPVFTDKLPHNFEHVGLIHKILPDAIIVDVRRNPMDCGYSLYKQSFTQGADFSYRLETIGRYYNGYLEIMDHWQTVLPGKVLTLQYEDLVASPETEVRGLLGHAGLEFETVCLEFHKTRRAVRTASSEQVRQPLNAKGIGAWKAVEAELQPLKDALGERTLSRFAHYL
jgi:tetratricopeptide (TPR) repeat protein